MIAKYNRAALKGAGEESILRWLQVIEPRARKVRYAKVGEKPVIYVDIGLSNLYCYGS